MFNECSSQPVVVVDKSGSYVPKKGEGRIDQVEKSWKVVAAAPTTLEFNVFPWSQASRPFKEYMSDNYMQVILVYVKKILEINRSHRETLHYLLLETIHLFFIASNVCRAASQILCFISQQDH